MGKLTQVHFKTQAVFEEIWYTQNYFMKISLTSLEETQIYHMRFQNITEL